MLQLRHQAQAQAMVRGWQKTQWKIISGSMIERTWTAQWKTVMAIPPHSTVDHRGRACKLPETAMICTTL